MFIWPNVFGYRLGIAKISLINLNSFLSYPEKYEGFKISPLRVKIRGPIKSDPLSYRESTNGTKRFKSV